MMHASDSKLHKYNLWKPNTIKVKDNTILKNNQNLGQFNTTVHKKSIKFIKEIYVSKTYQFCIKLQLYSGTHFPS